MSVHRIPLAIVADVWPAIESYAELALRVHPFMEAEDLLAVLYTGAGQLFIATDEAGIVGFAVAEVIRFPRVLVGNVVAAGGRRGFLKVIREELLPELERWSAEHGATQFMVQGRPGWIRIAEREGAHGHMIAQAWRSVDVGRRLTDS